MNREPGYHKVNASRIAWLLLIYSCIFILDDTPFTSVWDNLPQTGLEELVCAEDQEEGLAIISLLKIRLRSVSPRQGLPAATCQVATSLTSHHTSLQIHSGPAERLAQRKRSVDYCVFRI